MEQKKSKRNSLAKRQPDSISAITVSGYKSLSEEQRIEIRPLTILAGANSSGKSSIMQPLLLLKQTLEATYDPGPLLLDGPNVRFTSTDQLFSRTMGRKRVNTFSVGIELKDFASIRIYFHKQPKKRFDIQQMTVGEGGVEYTLHPGMTHDEIMAVVPEAEKGAYHFFSGVKKPKPELVVIRERCFLKLAIRLTSVYLFKRSKEPFEPHIRIEQYILNLIHIPGLRGNPARTYKTTATGPAFPGTFENYVASVIDQWKVSGDKKLDLLCEDLETELGITGKVTTDRIGDTRIELLVGRLPHAPKGGTHDLVSIADVGFGVSQVLPVVVALLVAKPGQIVYLEQPEIHLHPRAESAMAKLLVKAAKRGVIVVAETHSSLILRKVQTLVAQGDISPDLVKLHWFWRNPKDGITEIRSADLDKEGAFGDWPEDFDEVELGAESEYLDAVEAQKVS